MHAARHVNAALQIRSGAWAESEREKYKLHFATKVSSIRKSRERAALDDKKE